VKSRGQNGGGNDGGLPAEGVGHVPHGHSSSAEGEHLQRVGQRAHVVPGNRGAVLFTHFVYSLVANELELRDGRGVEVLVVEEPLIALFHGGRGPIRGGRVHRAGQLGLDRNQGLALAVAAVHCQDD